MSPHGRGGALCRPHSRMMLGAVVVDGCTAVVPWPVHPLLLLLLLLLMLLLLLLLGLHNLPPSRNWHQAVQGHLLAVHVHLVDDWQAVDG